MGRTHDATLKIDTAAPQRARAGATFRVANRWLPFCVLVLAIKLLLLWLDPTPKLFLGDSGSYIRTALIGSDSKGSILLLRLPGTLARGLAAQFYSAFNRSGARQRRNSDCVCADLQPLLPNVEQAFVSVRIVVRAGSLSACLGTLCHDREL
jgi:hypothetical protein